MALPPQAIELPKVINKSFIREDNMSEEYAKQILKSLKTYSFTHLSGIRIGREKETYSVGNNYGLTFEEAVKELTA